MPPLRPSLCLSPFRSPQLLRTFTTTPRPSLARISLVGRLAAQPELMPTSSGQEMVRYALGTGHGPRDNRTTTWWKVATFLPEGPARDAILALEKGSLLYVDGSCTINKFQDRDGKDQSALSITQRHFEILERRDENGMRVSGRQGPVSEESQPEGPE
ncbi:MAG: hypothetical protein LQ338_000977 [Usnochroma carphineum]|nr:MAG: hypothetical protein LQ338_000977 [Usnochroma carphineum]